MALSRLQQQFVNAYSGNIIQTMRALGDGGTDEELHSRGRRLLSLPAVQEALRSRYAYVKEQNKNIADRDDMLLWWTNLVKNEDFYDDSGKPLTMRDRLKASEYLGRAHTLFGERKEITHNVTITNLVEQAYQVTDAEVEDIVDVEFKEKEVVKELPEPPKEEDEETDKKESSWEDEF